MQPLTPKQIVAELDKYIVGQDAAKRAVAVAIRNRWRRQQLPPDLREEVCPSNIIMIGPTGVGKTEIARRLANLVNAPFVKIEATKYTEVGYHGRDVESMIRDLLDMAVRMVQTQQTEVVREEAERLAQEELLDALLPATETQHMDNDPHDDSMHEVSMHEVSMHEVSMQDESAQRRHRSREKLRAKLIAGELEDRTVDLTVEVKVQPLGMVTAFGSAEQIDPELQNFLEKMMPSQTKRRRVPVHQARKILFDQQCEKLIDRDKVMECARNRTESAGIVFVDEIDKVAGPQQTHGPDISRQGVQRDLLPIIEGCTVSTRHGPVRTDHILFIAAGAFSSSKPSDLMPELQGRLPIRVELDDLTRDDSLRILTEPENALSKQHVALLGTEKVRIEFTEDALFAVSDIAYQLNQSAENIGARRLMTVMERLMEDLSFEAPDRTGESVTIDADYVQKRLGDLRRDDNLSRFIL